MRSKIDFPINRPDIFSKLIILVSVLLTFPFFAHGSSLADVVKSTEEIVSRLGGDKDSPDASGASIFRGVNGAACVETPIGLFASRPEEFKVLYPPIPQIPPLEDELRQAELRLVALIKRVTEKLHVNRENLPSLVNYPPSDDEIKKIAKTMSDYIEVNRSKYRAQPTDENGVYVSAGKDNAEMGIPPIDFQYIADPAHPENDQVILHFSKIYLPMQRRRLKVSVPINLLPMAQGSFKSLSLAGTYPAGELKARLQLHPRSGKNLNTTMTELQSELEWHHKLADESVGIAHVGQPRYFRFRGSRGQPIGGVTLNYAEHGDLLHYLEKSKPEFSEALDMSEQLLKGLVGMERHGVLHRDIKPENVLISVDPKTGRLLAGISDFGLAVNIESASHSEALISPAGTLVFFPPEGISEILAFQKRRTAREQLNASRAFSTNRKMDVWALGLTLLDLLWDHVSEAGNHYNFKKYFSYIKNYYNSEAQSKKPRDHYESLSVLFNYESLKERGINCVDPPQDPSLRNSPQRKIYDAICRMLNPDPNLRPGPTEALEDFQRVVREIHPE